MNVMPLSILMGGLVKKISVIRDDLDKATSVGKFAGSWVGTMSFANSSYKNEIVLTIYKRCKRGGVCGSLDNKTNSCVWELTLDEVNGDVLSYTFSKTLLGNYPAGSVGKLILRSDGTIYRVHQTTGPIVSGSLTRQS
jgi:hypothetical protein